MLKGISWSDYAQAVGIALFFYYLFVVIRFRKKEPKDATQTVSAERDVTSKKRIWAVSEQEVATQLPARSTPLDNMHAYAQAGEHEVENLPIGDFEALEELAARIGELFATAGMNADPGKLFAAVRAEIARYPALHERPYRTAITNIVTGRAIKDCGITVTEEQMRQLWEGL